jgi:8-oxo-dGTP diphosphatase
MPNDREYPAHPLVGVGALIHDRAGRVLLVKRRFEPNKGTWTLPGGLLKTGETLVDGGRREIREELGVGIEIEQLFQVSEEIVRDAGSRVRFHYVLVDFLATIAPGSGEITLDEESAACDWFEPDEIVGLDAGENTKRIVAKYASQSRH